jgi:hypothetical protein
VWIQRKSGRLLRKLKNVKQEMRTFSNKQMPQFDLLLKTQTSGKFSKWASDHFTTLRASNRQWESSRKESSPAMRS